MMELGLFIVPAILKFLLGLWRECREYHSLEPLSQSLSQPKKRTSERRHVETISQVEGELFVPFSVLPGQGAGHFSYFLIVAYIIFIETDVCWKSHWLNPHVGEIDERFCFVKSPCFLFPDIRHSIEVARMNLPLAFDFGWGLRANLGSETLS